MRTDGEWRGELQRIQAAHRAAMTTARDRLRPVDVLGGPENRPAATPERGEELFEQHGSVLLPAHLDRRKALSYIETEPDQQRRSWLV